jgi:leucine-zipper-like transcriptional regulator 1
MELCNVSDKLFLFGGSGPHAFCFNDLYTFDPITSSWEHCNNFRDPEINQNPKARAGHSMTLVDCKLYIIGGSYGQDYLKDVYILDTDPQPDFISADGESLTKQSTMQQFLSGVHKMLNNQEFSDVTFVVEGRKFYGHKIIISQLSDKFKAMFSGTSGSSNQIGFKESQSSIIEIDNISYPIFT